MALVASLHQTYSVPFGTPVVVDFPLNAGRHAMVMAANTGAHDCDIQWAWLPLSSTGTAPIGGDMGVLAGGKDFFEVYEASYYGLRLTMTALVGATTVVIDASAKG